MEEGVFTRDELRLVRLHQLDVMLRMKLVLDRAGIDFYDHELWGEPYEARILDGSPSFLYPSGSLYAALPDDRVLVRCRAGSLAEYSVYQYGERVQRISKPYGDPNRN